MTGKPAPGVGKATVWIVGLAVVVIILAMVMTRGGDPAPPSTQAGVAPERQAAVQEPAKAELPTKYTGTWEGKVVTLEWRNGQWVQMTAGGTEDEGVAHYEQLARTELMTNTFDRSRNLYVRWPSTGGTVEQSKDGINWTETYEVTPA